MELLLGCGSYKSKKVSVDGNFNWNELITVDINPNHNPDLVYDLENIPLPFPDGYADEIHLYEVLEHTGYQGDYKFFFAQFQDFWRILKPNGYLFGTCPLWDERWQFGDPSHKRSVQRESFHFLKQQNYIDEVGKTAMSDFRYIYSADFSIIRYTESQYTFEFILQAINK